MGAQGETLYDLWNVMWILGIFRFKSINLFFYTCMHIIHMYVSTNSNVILKYFHFVLPDIINIHLETTILG
jgi:hypothetical protein